MGEDRKMVDDLSVENSVFSHAIKTFDTLKMNERTWSLSFIRRPWKQNKTIFWTNPIVQSKIVLSNRSLQPVQRTFPFNDTTETKMSGDVTWIPLTLSLLHRRPATK